MCSREISNAKAADFPILDFFYASNDFLFCTIMYFPKSNGYGQNCYITGNDGSSILWLKISAEPSSKLCFERFWCKISEFKCESSWDKPGKTLEKLRDDGQEVREKDDSKGEMKVHFFLDHKSLNYLVAPPCVRVETIDIIYASIQRYILCIYRCTWTEVTCQRHFFFLMQCGYITKRL